VVIIGGWRGPGWRIVTGDQEQARQVRDWIGSAVSRHDCPVDPADVTLAISELYANAVMHGPPGSRVLAGYCLWSAGARIVVCDGGGPTAPQIRRAESLAEGGRGLQVIDALAGRWGSFRLPGAQAVWCDFGQPLRAPDADAWAWLRRVLAAFPLGDSTPFRPACAGRCAMSLERTAPVPLAAPRCRILAGPGPRRNDAGTVTCFEVRTDCDACGPLRLNA
jgi:Histidine kinase-like ATPase domain